MRKALLIFLVLVGAAHAAITEDNAVDLGHFTPTTTATTSSYTATGSNLMLMLYITTTGGSAPTSAVTWGGVSMTRLGTVTNGASSDVWYIANATAGSHTFVITSNNATSFHVLAISYAGVGTTFDVASNTGGTFTSNTTNQGNNPLTSAYTTGVANDWLVLFGNSVGCYNALTGLSSKLCASSDVGSINDSNGPLTAGAQSVTTNVTGQGFTYANAILLVAMQPASATGTMTASPTAVPTNNTANIVVSLTGSSTSWTGSTVFTISGVSGVTLVTQSVTSNTAATITITTGTSLGSLVITETVTGSASTTIAVGLGAGSSTSAGVGLFALARAVGASPPPGTHLGVMVGSVCLPFVSGQQLTGTPLSFNSGTGLWQNGQGVTHTDTTAFNCLY